MVQIFQKYVFEKESGQTLCNWNIKFAHHLHIMLMLWPPAVGQLMISYLFVYCVLCDSNACWVSKGNQYYDVKITPWDFPAADKLIVTTFFFDLILKVLITQLNSVRHLKESLFESLNWWLNTNSQIDLIIKDNSKYYGMFLLYFVVQ